MVNTAFRSFFALENKQDCLGKLSGIIEVEEAAVKSIMLECFQRSRISQSPGYSHLLQKLEIYSHSDLVGIGSFEGGHIKM